MQKLLVVLLVGLACFAISVSAQRIGKCNPFDELPQANVDWLVQQLRLQNNTSARLNFLTNFVAKNTLGFSANATISILLQFKLSSERASAVGIMSKFILGLSSSEAIAILHTFSFTDDRLICLQAIVNYIMDAKNQTDLLLEEFAPCASDRVAALTIINNSKTRSCVYGEITLQRFDFIIDTSYSMDSTFTDASGVQMTRLGFVQKELQRVLTDALSPDQKFNVIRFSNTASSWQSGVVTATPENIASAVNYVRNLRTDGSTYVLNALQLAIRDPEVLGVYLLSDGSPSDDEQVIINTAVNWRRPVNTIAFMADQGGVSFLERLAKATGGTFRAFK